MNENIQNKRETLTEIENLIARKTPQTDDLRLYCQYMKRVFLSCSTDN